MQSSVMQDEDRPKPPDTRASEPAIPQAAQFFHNVPGTVWTTDDKLVLTFIEGAYLRRIDVNADRLIGKTIQSLLLDGRDEHPLIEAHIAALGGHRSNVRIEWGGRLYTARVGPLRTSANGIAGCVGILVEIGWIANKAERCAKAKSGCNGPWTRT